MHNSYIAILAAALAAWVFGAIWYGVLGKTWMAASGIAPDEIEAGARCARCRWRRCWCPLSRSS